MSDVEKKPYFDMQVKQKQTYMEWITKEKGNTEVKKEMASRCSMKKVSILFKEMQKRKIDGVVGELGFSPLLGMKNRAIHRELCRELATNFDLESSMMEYKRHKISLMIEDVEVVLGLKNEGLTLKTY